MAPFLKISFSKISFLSIKRCILLAEGYGKRGGVLRPQGGGGGETTPQHSQGLREHGGDCTENEPLSVHLVPSRLGTTHSCFGLHTPVHFLCNQGTTYPKNISSGLHIDTE